MSIATRLVILQFLRPGLLFIGFWQVARLLLYRVKQSSLKQKVCLIGLLVRFSIIWVAVLVLLLDTFNKDGIERALKTYLSYFACFSTNIVSILLQSHAQWLRIHLDRSVILRYCLMVVCFLRR